MKLSGQSNSYTGFKENSVVCWNKLRMLRTNSLCTTCSAWNYQYYKYQLFGMGLPDCQNFIKTCESFFFTYNSIFSIVRGRFNTILVGLNPLTTYTATYAGTTNYHTIKEMINLYSLQLNALQFNDLAGAEQYQIKLCQKMLSIHQDPILYRLTTYLKSATEAFISEYSRLTGRTLKIKFPSTRNLVDTLTAGAIPATEFPGQEVHVLRSSTTDTANNMINPDGSSYTVKPANISLVFP